MPNHVFVYGTLRPGDVRWRFLQPFVIDDGWSDAVEGRLFDTGLDYPAAIFDGRVEAGGTVLGQTYALDAASVERCLAVLDREEDTVGGRYRRIVVTTSRGVAAHAYEYGSDLDLVPIASGDWFEHRASVRTARPDAIERPTLER
ncbi:MAG: gamma-glutamylcyclotransferase family protein [Ilumatobacter sp.]